MGSQQWLRDPTVREAPEDGVNAVALLPGWRSALSGFSKVRPCGYGISAMTQSFGAAHAIAVLPDGLRALRMHQPAQSSLLPLGACPSSCRPCDEGPVKSGGVGDDFRHSVSASTSS